jgi:hypothetical protein
VLLNALVRILGTIMTIRKFDLQQDATPVLTFFEEIAAAEGWQPGDQLRAHQERSLYFGVWEEGGLGQPIGGLQLVVPNAEGQVPAHLVWPELPKVENLSSLLHVAVLAVASEYRGKENGAVFWHLGVELWRHCVENGVKTLWLEATPKTLRGYKLLGWPLVIQGELRTHWGEPCYPCTLSVREVAGSLAERAVDSERYRSLFLEAIAPTSAT